jgi:hypothetical protein
MQIRHAAADVSNGILEFPPLFHKGLLQQIYFVS